MNNGRRQLLKTLLATTAGASLGGCATPRTPDARLDELDAAAARPVLKRELFDEPIILERIELLNYGDSFLCRVRSGGGAVGWSVSNNLRMDYLYPIFTKRVQPYFLGKDARDLDALVEGAYRYLSNYKMQSYAVGVPLATIEFAVLDMLGRMAGRPLGALIGELTTPRVGIYLATRFRDRSADESIARTRELIERGGYRAVKFKIGEKMGNNREQIAGRTERLIPLAREAFGSDMWLGVDANGGYDVTRAIEVGRQLTDYGYDMYEEPVPFDWYRETTQVARGCGVPVAGGEQEASLRNFRWMVADATLQIYRQDMFYFGGMIRSMHVARMAHLRGYTCVPHLSGSGLGYLYALHFISALPNPGAFHPNSRQKDNPIPIHCDTSSLEVENGYVKVPTGPGLGVTIDPDFVARHTVVGT